MPEHNTIRSIADLRREERALRQRIRVKEEELLGRINKIPGELFYSSVDNILPNFIKGRVSSVALNAGRGVINTFFLKRAPAISGPLKILTIVKPSNLLKKAGTGISAIFKRKKK